MSDFKRDRAKQLIQDFLNGSYNEWVGRVPKFLREEYQDKIRISCLVLDSMANVDETDLAEKWSVQDGFPFTDPANNGVNAWASYIKDRTNAFTLHRFNLSEFYKTYIAQNAAMDNTSDTYNDDIEALTRSMGNAFIDNIILVRPNLETRLRENLETYIDGLVRELEAIDAGALTP